MNLVAGFLKIIGSAFGIAFTIIGACFSGYFVLIGEMKAGDNQVKTEIRREMYSLRSEREAKIEGINTRLQSIDDKLNILIERK